MYIYVYVYVYMYIYVYIYIYTHTHSKAVAAQVRIGHNIGILQYPISIASPFVYACIFTAVLLEQASKIQQRTLGHDHPHTVRLLSSSRNWHTQVP